MTILDKIVERKRVEVSEAQAKVSIEELSEYPLFSRTCYSLKESVLDPQRTGIISEYNAPPLPKASSTTLTRYQKLSKDIKMQALLPYQY